MTDHVYFVKINHKKAVKLGSYKMNLGYNNNNLTFTKL